MGARDDNTIGSRPRLTGWVAVLAVFQLLLLGREVLLLIAASQNFVRGIPPVGFNPGARPYSALFGGNVVIHAVFITLLVCAIALMGLRRQSLLRWFRLEMKFFMVLPILEIFWIVVAPWPGSVRIFTAAVVAQVVAHLIIGWCWLSYVEKSRRVSVTFVR